MTYRKIFEEKAAQKEKPSQEEVLAFALDKINHADGRTTQPTAMRISEAALRVACDKYVRREIATGNEAYPSLTIDYFKIKSNAKFNHEIAETVSLLVDALLERHGVYEGQKYYITTNDDRVNTLCESLNVKETAKPPDVSEQQVALAEKITVKMPLSFKKPRV